MIVQQASSEQSDSAIIYGMLRSELAAVEAYAHAIEALQGSSVVVSLEQILREHQSIALLLREWERPIGITSTLKTGSWGFFASAVAKIAALIGPASLLSALKSGERYGESLYRHALGNPDLSDSFRFLIGSQLLPQCQRNIRQLERMDLANKPITSPETM